MAGARVKRRRPRRNSPRRGRLLTRCFYHDAHPVSTDNTNGSVWRNEFTLGDHIDGLIEKARFAARSQDRNRYSFRPWRKIKGGSEFAWRARQRWAGRV